MSYYKRSTREMVFEIVNHLLITLITIACFYPMYHVVMASFSEPVRVMNHQGLLLSPLGFSLEGYRIVLNNPNVYIGYVNTIFYVTVGTAVNMVMTVLGAYVLSRSDFMLKKFCSLIFVFTMYFTGGIIPNFLLVKNLGMLDTRWALIIPGAIATWNMLILRTAFAGVPDELEEAAIIDGANDLEILLHVIIPVSMASLAVILLFYAVGHWNAWFNAMIYLSRSRELYPLQLFLREILISNMIVEGTDTTVDFVGELIKYCTIVVSTVPILLLYPFLQRFFTKGVMLGSVKG